MIILMLILIALPGLCFLYFKFGDNNEKIRFDFKYLIFLVVLIPALIVLALNIVLINKLGAQLSYYIKPSEIYMGYFSSSEKNSIENGAYVKDSTFQYRLIGTLNEVISSNDKQFAYRQCSNRRQCTYYYIHSFTYELLCNNQSMLFYKDCQDADSFSLTMELKYLDGGGYPRYNCVKNTDNSTCVNKCVNLISNYELILIQQYENKVQLAWTGLSKCNSKPNAKLIYDSTINPCSSSAFNSKFKVKNLILGLVIVLKILIF